MQLLEIIIFWGIKPGSNDKASCSSGSSLQSGSKASSQSDVSSSKKYALVPSELMYHHPIRKCFHLNNIKIINDATIIHKYDQYRFLVFLIDSDPSVRDKKFPIYNHIYDFYCADACCELLRNTEVQVFPQTRPEELKKSVIISALNKKISFVEKLLKYGVDIKLSVKNGERNDQTFLHFAAESGRNTLCKLLLAYGMNVNAGFKAGGIGQATPLHIAAENGNMELIKLFLKYGAEVNACSYVHCCQMKTPLHFAADKGNLELAILLLERNADTDLKEKDGATPFHNAVANDNIEFCKLLWENGGNINAKRYDGVTPLHIAVSQAEHRFRPKSTELNSIRTWSCGCQSNDTELDCILQESVKRRARIKMIRFLLKHGANPNAKSQNGVTPLHCAILNHDQETTELLLKHGANAEAKTKWLKTPVHYGAQEEDINILLMLLDQGADINARTSNCTGNSTPLSNAIENGELKFVKTLLKLGADVHVKMENSKTALHRSVEFNCAEKTKLLLEHGADVNAQTSSGLNALSIAAFRHTDSADTLNCLVKFGARGIFGNVLIEDVNYSKTFDLYLDHLFFDFDAASQTNIQKFFDHPFALSPDFPDYKTCMEKLACQVIKIETAHDCIGPRIPNIIFRTLKLHELKGKCEGEIIKMHFDKVPHSDVSLRSLLIMSTEQVSCFFQNSVLLDALKKCATQKKYPIYHRIIQCQIAKGHWRMQLMNVGKKFFSFIFKGFQSLPFPIKEYILRLLTNQDILILGKCFSVKQLKVFEAHFLC